MLRPKHLNLMFLDSNDHRLISSYSGWDVKFEIGCPNDANIELRLYLLNRWSKKHRCINCGHSLTPLNLRSQSISFIPF